PILSCLSFFFTHPSTTVISTLSLHDALPISSSRLPSSIISPASGASWPFNRLKQVVLPAPFGPMIATSSPEATLNEMPRSAWTPDRKSTRLNSSHDQISYAVFCLKKKKKNKK